MAVPIPPYKAVEKRHKYYKSIDEATDVIKFNEEHPKIFLHSTATMFGRECNVYGVHGYEGFYVIPDAIPQHLQLEVAHFALHSCPEPPNSTNLTIFNEDVTSVWQRERSLCSEPIASGALPKHTTLAKLRWTSLGFQYDWTARQYPQASTELTPSAQVFPAPLSQLTKAIVAACDKVGYSIEPEAAIVNYFPLSSCMGGHKDNAELTYEPPVVSMSLGCTAIFLVGGDTRDEEPVSVLLRPGTVVFLGGESRLRMHGISKVFRGYKPEEPLAPIHTNIGALMCDRDHKNCCDKRKNDTCSYCKADVLDETETQQLLNYLEIYRVNINVRQVYPSAGMKMRPMHDSDGSADELAAAYGSAANEQIEKEAQYS